MKKSTTLKKGGRSIIFLIVILPLLIIGSCQKEDSVILNAEVVTEADSPQLKSANVSDYLLELIQSIETMLEDGILTSGNANALIVKVKNARKSLDKGNTNALNGQLGAFINEVEDFVDSGLLTEEQGNPLINVADYVVDLLSEDKGIIYSNLSPDGTLGANGWSINGNTTHSYSFIPLDNYIITSVDLAISDISENYPYPMSHEFDLAIYSDDNGKPGDILITERETAPFFPYYEKPTFLTNVLFNSEITVEAGNKYWIAVHPASIPADLGWWWNAYGITSEDFNSTPPTLGGEWNYSAIRTEGAYQINGTLAKK